MPATSDKAAAEKAAIAEAAAKEQPQDPLKQVQLLVEKKIRNLEKRKVSIDRPLPLYSLRPLSTGETGPAAQRAD